MLNIIWSDPTYDTVLTKFIRVGKESFVHGSEGASLSHGGKINGRRLADFDVVGKPLAEISYCHVLHTGSLLLSQFTYRAKCILFPLLVFFFSARLP